MMSVLMSFLLTLRGCVRTRAALHAELPTLLHQIHVLEPSRPRRRRLTPTDRLLWVWISHVRNARQAALLIVTLATVIAWHRQGFRVFVLIILAHDRRRIVQVAVTAHPTSTWTAQHLREAFPWDQAPRFLRHNRDHAFDGVTAAAMGMDAYSRHRDHPGSMPMSNGSSGPFDESASIT